MALVDTQWALQSILQLSHHQLRAGVATPMFSAPTTHSEAIRVTSMPRVMQTINGSRILLLARRPTGIAGVELGYGGRVPWTLSHSTVEGVKPSKKSRLLAAYLHRQGFETTPTSPRVCAAPQPPLILHTNHLIGWKLNRNAAAAFPLYAHTLGELQQLRKRELMALRPHACLVAHTYSEWDNWREVLCEPGWDFFGASDDAVERMLRDGVTAPLVDEEGDVCKVEVS